MSAGGWWYEWLALGQANPADYDAVEVQACRSFDHPDGRGACVEAVDPENAEFWSAFVRCKTGDVECIGDFETKAEAVAYAGRVAAEQGYRLACGMAQ